MDLFKGYVLTKNKKCLEKFKDRNDLKSYDEVKSADEFAGILADDVILIDIDDSAQAEIMMDIVEDKQLDCRVYQTTRGKHFLFKNDGVKKCGTHVKLACGLEADIKVGAKNSYSILKFKGEERFIEWDSESYQTVPKWLFPVKTNTDFLAMEAGDGRNTALFSYILSLLKAGLTKDEAREAVKVLNKYVLKDPLSESEINTITRDEAFPEMEEIFFDDTGFLHNKFGDYLIKNNHIIRLNGLLHVYRDGVYIEGSQYIENQMLQIIPDLKAFQRTEVLKYLNVQCLENAEAADARYIAFANGVFDLVERVLRPFSPDLIITNKIPWDYNPDAYSAILDATLDKIACNDEDIRAILEESIGYAFYRRNELSKSFILTGEGANGKSTFLDIVKDILGPRNISALGLEELGERFSISYMNGKLANIGDDIADDFLQGKELANFKKIVSGNLIKAEVKNKVVSDEDNIKPTVKIFFSANVMPRTKSKGFQALLRRLVKIPFNAKFSKDDPDFDPFISWKLKAPEVMEYGILLGIQGLYRILENNDFTQSQMVEEELKNYEIENNPILSFLDSDVRIENQPVMDVYREYKKYCIENGFSETSAVGFGRELCKRLNLVSVLKKINGKAVRIYEVKQ